MKLSIWILGVAALLFTGCAGTYVVDDRPRHYHRGPSAVVVVDGPRRHHHRPPARPYHHHRHY